MKWTSDQTRAIECGGNIIVSAAAGSGKTAVLTERVARLVMEGNSIDKILVLTFTRAAAAEMKERIAKRLIKEADKESGTERRAELRAQADLCANASISTIHSFCSKVVNRHFHKVDLSPKAKVMDETESAMMRTSVMEKLMLHMAENDKENYHLLIRGFEQETRLIESIYKLYEFSRAQPFPESWLVLQRQKLFSREYGEEIMDSLIYFFCQELEEYGCMLQAVNRGLSPEYAKVISAIDQTLLSLRGVILHKDRESYLQALNALPFPRLSYPKGTEDFVKKPVGDARDKLKKLVKQQLDALTKDTETRYLEQMEGACVFAALIDACLLFGDKYLEEKREKALIDFNDLEHFTLRILSDEEIASEYRERFAAVIVDEYQDSNRVQEAILQRIRRPDNSFIVGDVKQSIYRFRMAEPKLFIEKLDEYTGDGGTNVYLNKNFRSGKAVINAVNNCFTKLMNPFTGSIDYSAQQLVQGANCPDGCVECHIIERGGDEMEFPEAEASLCAAEILRLIESESMTEDGVVRPYRFDDFAVLMRNKTHAAAWAKTFTRLGIPCFVQLEGGFFDTIEVMLLLNALSVIDNRRQDIPLLSVMRSCIGGFSDEELCALRLDCTEGELIDCVLKGAGQDTPLGTHCANFLEFIESYRRLSTVYGVSTLVGKLLDETSLYHELGVLAGGEQRQANLDALLDRARAYDEIGGGTVHGFLRYMKQAQSGASMGMPQTVARNVVRLMTIHKSKGLEYPVVFLCGLGGNFNRSDYTEALLLHSDVGIGGKFMNEQGIKRETLARSLAANCIRREQIAEELRLLYVGMTRAMQRLWLVGSIKNAQRALRELPELNNAEVRSSSNAMRWILMALNGHVLPVVHGKDEFTSENKKGMEAVISYDEQGAKKLIQHFKWEYPYKNEVGIPNKTSVTTLADEGSADFEKPTFITGDYSPVRRGTITHALLERMPLEALDFTQMQAFANSLGVKERKVIELCAWFAGTELFGRMIQSSNVRRELAFAYPADTEWLLNRVSMEKVLLQGVIDACFIEDDAWVLIDYKTDYIGNQDPVAYAEKHRKQLELYASVLEKITKRRVSETCLVLLDAKAVVRLNRTEP